MAEPADRVVEGLGRREGLVSTLVGQHPQTSTEETLQNGVQGPQGSPGWSGRDVFRRHIGVKEIESGGEGGEIAYDISKTFGSGPGEAMCRDSISDLLDGEIGQVELIAIGVEQLPVHGLQVQVIDRLQGGKRG